MIQGSIIWEKDNQTVSVHPVDNAKILLRGYKTERDINGVEDYLVAEGILTRGQLTITNQEGDYKSFPYSARLSVLYLKSREKIQQDENIFTWIRRGFK